MPGEDLQIAKHIHKAGPEIDHGQGDDVQPQLDCLEMFPRFSSLETSLFACTTNMNSLQIFASNVFIILFNFMEIPNMAANQVSQNFLFKIPRHDKLMF